MRSRLALAIAWAGAALSPGLVIPPAAAQVPARNLVLRAHLNEYPIPGSTYSYSACWSYVHPDGREYAVLGAQGGTAIYNVTNPASTYRVGFIPGPSCLWREMKSYRTWIYTVSECLGTNEGLQVISMADPEHPVLTRTYTTIFDRSHTVSVDTTRAVLICNGTRSGTGLAMGMRILSLADPANPVEIGRWPVGALPVSQAEYVHDCVPIGNRLFASSIYYGIQRIFDFTNPASPVEIHSWTYPGGFTHNAWPDASGNYLYVTDEVRGQLLKVFDISIPTAPVLTHAYTPNPEGIVHNAHVKGNELYLANYSEGVRVLDLSDPAHPAEFAWADTYAGLSGGYYGVWEFCPFFPSGIAIASDMQTGLYVFDVTRDYGLLTVIVTEAGPGTPLPEVEVKLLEQGDLRITGDDGVLRFAPNPGLHTLRVKRFGFDLFEAPFTVGVGTSDTAHVALVRQPTGEFSGTVVDHVSGLPLEDGEVDLEDTPLHAHTDGAGAFLLGAVPEDTYGIVARRPGYVPASITRALAAPASAQNFRLRPAPVWDNLETETGWTIGAPGDNATSGVWVRVEPMGTGSLAATVSPTSWDPGGGLRRRPPLKPQHEGLETDGLTPGDVQPEFDRTPGAGQLCFVTGQGTSPGSIGEADVDNGATSLTTPVFDATGFADPAFGFWRWFYATSLEDDYLLVQISNNGGTSWTTVSTTHGIHAHWEEETVRIADYLPATSQMRLRFVAADQSPGTIVEATIDDLTLYDASLPVLDTPPAAPVPTLSLHLLSANPVHDGVSFALEAPAGREVEVLVVDVRGRLVRKVHQGPAAGGALRVDWDGRDANGRSAPSGLYFALARSGAVTASTRFLRVR